MPATEAATFAHQVATRREDYTRQRANAERADHERHVCALLSRHADSLRDAGRELMASLTVATTPTDRSIARALHAAWVDRAHNQLQEALR